MRWIGLTLALLAGAATGETLTGQVVSVYDGDTLTVHARGERIRVRLAGIDAPEAKQAFGVAAARSLARLCLRKSAKVEWQERAGDVVLGQVECDGKDVNAEQVRRGMAWVSPKQMTPASPLPELEAYARLRALGLWRGEKPVPPWEWRAGGN